MNDFSRRRWQKWLSRVSIPRLTNYIVAGMFMVYVLDLAMTKVDVYGLFMLTRSGLLRGELWRIVTFAILPPGSSPIWLLFTLYFYWIIGNTLANQWGSQRFTLFYLTGMLGNVIAALITGRADNTYLNLSMFFAFATVAPDHQMLLFYFLPVKVKYLAALNAVVYLYQFIMGGWTARVMIIFSLLNLVLFLGGDFLNLIRREAGYYKTRHNFRKAMRGK